MPIMEANRDRLRPIDLYDADAGGRMAPLALARAPAPKSGARSDIVIGGQAVPAC